MPSDQKTDRQSGRQADQQSSHGGTTEPQRERRRSMGERLSVWFAAAAVRMGLTIIGVVVLIFALGQAVGLDLLGLFVEALNSQTGQWLVVAFFAILLIAAAQRGISYRG